jgi:hypothetical protein
VIENKQCPESATYQGLLARADELERTWNPTGYYTWNDMSDVIAATIKLSGQASSAAITFNSGNSTPSAKDRVNDARDNYWAVAKRANDYTEAWQTARATGKPIAAPGFKQWVVDDLRAAAGLFRAIEVSACQAPWWLGAAVSFSSFFVDVVNVAKRVLGIVLKLGEAAIKAGETTADILAFLLPKLPYIALAVGGYLAYKAIKKRQ